MFHFQRIAAGLCLMLLTAAGAAEYKIPYLEKAPVIDGTFAPGEWDQSAGYAGLYHRGSEMFLSGRHAVWNIGYDKENLYVSMRTELPPEGSKLISTTRKRDGKTLLFDDAKSLKNSEYTYYTTSIEEVFYRVKELMK